MIELETTNCEVTFLIFLEIVREQWSKNLSYTMSFLFSMLILIWLLPFLMHHFVIQQLAIAEIAFIISLVALFLILLQTLFHTLSELQRLYTERDIAFYLPIPLWQIICSRLLVELFTSTLVLIGVIASMLFALLHDDAYSLQLITAVLSLMFFVILYAILTTLALSLILFPLWHLCTKYIGKWGYAIFFVLFIGMMMLLYQLEQSALYKNFIEIGPTYNGIFKFEKVDSERFLNIEDFYTNVYIVEDAFIFIFSVLFFFVGLTWTKRSMLK